MTRIALLLMAGLCACGGPDLTNSDNYPMEVTRYVDENGVEYTEYKQLPFDYDLYGQAEQALLSPPPNRYGIDSAISGSSNDTRCISGGHTSGSAYCQVTGTKHINWSTVAVDHSHDSTFGVDVPNYVRLGLTQMAQDSLNSGFTLDRDNPNRSIDGTVSWATCTSGFLCTNWVQGPITLAGGQRVGLSAGGFTIKIDPNGLVSAIGTDRGTQADHTQKALSIMNLVAHEAGHSEGFGHVPTAESGVDVMNLQNSGTNQAQKHLSTTEKNQLTAWIATF